MRAIPTGIGTLDNVITGLNRSDLIILAARPGMGKTSFALNIMRHVAVSVKKRVAFFLTRNVKRTARFKTYLNGRYDRGYKASYRKASR